MSEEQQDQPPTNELTQNIVTSLDEYKDFQRSSGEKSGLEQRIELIEDHKRKLAEERERIA